jgi:predicted nucleic acid-binding protein
LIEEFIGMSKEFILTEEIITKTAEMRRSVKIKLPDAVIATTAMVNDFILLSDNDKDFGKVAHLRYVSPTKL